jgi:hypothetical protein
MEFIKNHYEKVLLSLVLLGLAVTVALLPAKIQSVDTAVQGGSQKPLTPMDLRTNEAALTNLSSLPQVVLSGSNNVFNPVQWRRKADGSLWKITSPNEVGPGAVRITKTNSPLYFSLSFDGINLPNYQIGVTQETNKNVNLRGKVPRYGALNEKTEFFKIIRIVGAVEAPDALVLEVGDLKEQATVSKEKPFKVIAGYTTDLAYPPQNLTWREKRVGENLVFDGDTNNIVEITANEVVLSASSGKRTTIKYNAAP